MSEVNMTNYQFISDYKDISTYKESFNELAKMVFGLDFEKWYEKGGWNENYICYSFLDKGKVIANASASKMTVICNSEEYKAIQIGTVMTHPDYRNQGLSGKLMNHIIEKYEQEYDFIYLFANDSVLDYYPRFGFRKTQESSFTLNISGLELKPEAIRSYRKLHTNNANDYRLMEQFAKERISVSPIMGVKNNEHLLLFYFILAFNDAIYYVEEVDAIVIFKHEDKQLHLYDIISVQKVDYDVILNSLVTADTEIIHFYFTPDYDNENIHVELLAESEDTLFVRPSFEDRAEHILFPLTSHS
ncbi:GNAT family N-acetyltransferase [Paenibacillus sp. 2TAB26]|uniref:GNAT family N-acetyltransferase n=1 Tax=Paenibacillus sp. 2TAB26 TaxID=3233005 RepID=UPI003F996D53